MAERRPVEQRSIEQRVLALIGEASARRAAGFIIAATVSLVVAAGVLMRVFDRHEFKSVWAGMWFSLQTVTTVGYGDMTPRSPLGRISASVVMLGGISLLAIVTATITSTFIERAQREFRAEEAAEEERAGERLDTRFDEVDARLERIEAALSELTRR
jgi:voltage-gated potassium channel